VRDSIGTIAYPPSLAAFTPRLVAALQSDD
jgi:hypothetical protein